MSVERAMWTWVDRWCVWYLVCGREDKVKLYLRGMMVGLTLSVCSVSAERTRWTWVGRWCVWIPSMTFSGGQYHLCFQTPHPTTIWMPNLEFHYLLFQGIAFFYSQKFQNLFLRDIVDLQVLHLVSVKCPVNCSNQAIALLMASDAV